MKATAPTLAVLALALAAPAVAEPFLTLDKPDSHALMSAGFELGREAEVRIEAVGLARQASSSFPLWSPSWSKDRDDSAFLVYAWLLDGSTRRPVWVMDMREAQVRVGSRRLREVQTSVRLPPGRYELYLFAGAGPAKTPGAGEPRERGWWDRTLDYFTGSEPVQNLHACFVSLTSGELATGIRRFDVTGDLTPALIRDNRAGNSRLFQAGFALRRPTALRLYGMVEQVGGSRRAADFGWIVDARTRKVVWHSYEGSRRPHAGGGDKNRLIDEEVRLPPGRYLLRYGTDDSHAYPAFNANPPHDPLNWGITLLPGSDFDTGAFERFEPVEPEPLIESIKMGDGASFERPFRLLRKAELDLRATGEMVRSDVADGAAIVEAGSGKAVWEMTESNTMPAGGTEKNRMFDGLVQLQPGDYILRYRTDDSHSYPHWNAAAPFVPEAWGVSLRPGPDFDPRGFQLPEATGGR